MKTPVSLSCQASLSTSGNIFVTWIKHNFAILRSMSLQAEYKKNGVSWGRRDSTQPEPRLNPQDLYSPCAFCYTVGTVKVISLSHSLSPRRDLLNATHCRLICDQGFNGLIKSLRHTPLFLYMRLFKGFFYETKIYSTHIILHTCIHTSYLSSCSGQCRIYCLTN